MCLQMWLQCTYKFVYNANIPRQHRRRHGGGEPATGPGRGPLPPPLRSGVGLYVLEWVEWPDLKMEVYGCPAA